MALDTGRACPKATVAPDMVSNIPLNQVPPTLPGGSRGSVAMKQVVADTAPPQAACDCAPASAGEGT